MTRGPNFGRGGEWGSAAASAALVVCRRSPGKTARWVEKRIRVPLAC